MYEKFFMDIISYVYVASSQNTYQTNLSGIISVSNGIPISYEISINTEEE